MARRARRSVTSRGSATPSVARHAAPSRHYSRHYVEPYVPQSHRVVLPRVSVPQRGNSRVRAAPPRRLAPSRGVSFGTWYLPPTPSRLEPSRPLQCARRAIRKSVLFAKKLTGAGSHARKKHFSNRSCK